MTGRFFSWSRFLAMLVKEFTQMRRDKLTFGMIVGIPLIQLVLFGYAINTNPHHLPTAVVSADHSIFTRTFIRGLKNTKYFQVKYTPHSVKAARELLSQGKVLFVVSIPPDFTQKLVRNQRPQVLIEADGTEPVAVSNALAAVPILNKTVFNPALKANLASLKNAPDTVNVVLHARYNPERITQYNIVPALLGVVLTMTMVMVTSVAITREYERGTMESLLATPVRPFEVMVGKILPYVIVGYLQVILMLLASFYLFHVPIQGSLSLLMLMVLPFIAANLAVGLTFSTIAKNQLQAVQLAFFFFLPSILLSGFMFPFDGMPKWAQWIGETLPLTHFVRITRGILLKGDDWMRVWQGFWPMGIFLLVALVVAVKRYRQTLD